MSTTVHAGCCDDDSRTSVGSPVDGRGGRVEYARQPISREISRSGAPEIGWTCLWRHLAGSRSRRRRRCPCWFVCLSAGRS